MAILIQIKIILHAIIIKLKKFFNSKYDPYMPLENNFNFNPFNITLQK